MKYLSKENKLLMAVQIKGSNKCGTFQCSHLASISSKLMSLDPTSKNSRDSSKSALFCELARYGHIKSIDFGLFQASCNVLLEVFSRCPQLECVNLENPVFQPVDKWDRLLDQIGHMIVHLGWSRNKRVSEAMRKSVSNTDSGLLDLVAKKCANIKQVTVNLDWISKWRLTKDMLTAIKMLPKNCLVALHCDIYCDGVFEDVVDHLEVNSLHWPKLEHRYDRLSILKLEVVRLNSSKDRVRGVDFAGLKKLEIAGAIDSESIGYLVDCRFPRLDEFSFNACLGLKEVEYEALFQRMATVKKLTILYGYENDSNSQLPRSVIQLKNINAIYLKVKDIPKKKESKDLFYELKQFVDAMRLLKRITVELNKNGSFWRNKYIKKALENQINKFNMKQKRIKVDLIS